MVDPAVVYVGGVLVLFFFWIYGIVAFVRDAKNVLIPWFRQYRRQRGTLKDERDEDANREENERQLY